MTDESDRPVEPRLDYASAEIRPPNRVMSEADWRARFRRIAAKVARRRTRRTGLGAFLLVLGSAMTSSDVQEYFHGSRIEKPSQYLEEWGLPESFWGSYRVMPGSKTAHWSAGMAEAVGWVVAAVGVGLLGLTLGGRSNRLSDLDAVLERAVESGGEFVRAYAADELAGQRPEGDQ